MAQPILNRPRVVPFVSQRVAAGVAQHVNVNLERKTGALTDALHQAVDRVGGKGGSALGLEDVAAAGLPLKLPESAHFITADRMGGRLAILHAPNMQGRGPIELDLRPFQITYLDSPQSVSVGYEYQRRVTMPVAPLASSPNKRFDLGGRQILPRTQFAITGTRRSPAPRSN